MKRSVKPKQVTAAILIKDDKVLIAQRPFTDPLAGKWEFPGGKVEAFESHEECLRRELQEELGIRVQVLSLFGRNRHRYGSVTIDLWAYRVRWVSGEPKPRFHADLKWVPAQDLDRFDSAEADRPFVQKLRGMLDIK